MTPKEARCVMEAKRRVEYKGIRYARIQAIIYRMPYIESRVDERGFYQAELLCEQGNAIVIANPDDVRLIEEETEDLL